MINKASLGENLNVIQDVDDVDVLPGTFLFWIIFFFIHAILLLIYEMFFCYNK